MSLATLRDDLISWWSMDDDPDGLQSDEMSRLALTGVDLEQITGIVGDAVEFNGTTSQLYHANNGLVQLEGRAFTFAGWFKFNSLSADAVLISKSNDSSLVSQYKLLYNQSVTSLQFRVGHAGGERTALAFNGLMPPLNRWHFIVVWLDDPTGYVNIRMNDSDYYTASVSALIPEMDVNTLSFSIGSDPDGSDVLDGAVDNVALWARELTREEQALLWNDGMGLPFCSIEETDCKSVTCCDRGSYTYAANSASEA